MRAAWLALTIHLLGAGGIGMVTIVQLWLWMVIGGADPERKNLLVQSTRYCRETQTTVNLRIGRWERAAALGWLSAAAGCLMTALIPNLIGESAMEASRGKITLAEARRLLELAIEADPLAPGPRQTLAEVLLAQWHRQGCTDDRLFELGVQQQQAAIARDPYAAKRYQTLGEFWWQNFQSTRSPEAARESVNWHREAVARYPNHPRLQAELALAQQSAGDDAGPAARRALELHRLNAQLQHYDKLLPKAQLAELESIVASGGNAR